MSRTWFWLRWWWWFAWPPSRLRYGFGCRADEQWWTAMVAWEESEPR